MPDHYRAFFGLYTDPFRSDLSPRDILPTGELQSVTNKIVYGVQLGSAAIVTGEIGSGKSTAIRYAAANFHPSEHKILYITATSGTIMEFYRQIVSELGLHRASNSKAVMTGLIKKEIRSLVEDKINLKNIELSKIIRYFLSE
ncbi:MAG: ATP-binding protein [Thermodesulfobacteriota bacterium]|nr:ATP-binding protein [Thermodesulfobacteriota bacterium]